METATDFLGPALYNPEARFLQFSGPDRVEKAANGRTRAIISSRVMDRMGDIVEPLGGDFSNYRKNPVVLFGHDYSQTPVGRCTDLQVSPDDLRAEIEWCPTLKGNELKVLYENGFMHAFSIGFQPIGKPGTTKAGGQHFTRWTLLEFSAVSVPANPEALALGKSLSRDEMRHGLATNHAKHFDVFELDEHVKQLRLIRAAGMADIERMFNGTTKILRYIDHDGAERVVIQHD